MDQAAVDGARAERTASRLWLLSRIDRQSREALDELLSGMAETIATATADAVTVRMLSPDGRQLLPVCAHHPDPGTAAAIAAIMQQTAAADSGLWAEVVARRQARRWQIDPRRSVADASADQNTFIGRYLVRAVLGLPLVDGDQLVGGMALFRLGVARPYTDQEQSLAEECARLVAPVVGLQRRIGQDEP